MNYTMRQREIRPGEWLHATRTRPDGRLYVRTTRRSSKYQTAYVVEFHDHMNERRYSTAFLNRDHAAAWYKQVTHA